MEPLKCLKGLGGIQLQSPQSYVQKQRPVTNLHAYLIPSTTRLSLYWQRRRPDKCEATAQHKQREKGGREREREITLSFILQLCAKALEPSIFSKCRFFMKASGNFNSFMSASSSSATPVMGERSWSESIFIRALQERGELRLVTDGIRGRCGVTQGMWHHSQQSYYSWSSIKPDMEWNACLWSSIITGDLITLRQESKSNASLERPRNKHLEIIRRLHLLCELFRFLPSSRIQHCAHKMEIQETYRIE